jgi:hypothetical protein
MADGLINYGILDPKLGGSFSTGYREAEENRVQSEASQIKLDQLKQDRQMMTQFQQQLRSMGKNPDLGVIFDALIATGKPEYVAQGVEGHRRLTAQKEFAKIQGGESEAAPPPMMAQPPTNALAPANALGSDTFGMGPTNALATPPAAPVNALAAQPRQIAQTESQIRKLMQFAASNPEMSTQAMAQARILQDQLELYSRRGQAESPDAAMMQRLGYPLTQEGFRAYQEAKRAPPPATKNIANVSPGDFTPASLAKFNTSGNYGDLILKPVDRAPRPEAAVRTQQVTMSNGKLGIMNMDTGVVTPATLNGAPVTGKPSAFAEKTAAQKAQLGKDLSQAITELTDATKDGGLIDQSTGSGAGRLIDLAAGFGGQATKGAIAIGELQPIADMALKMVPRFEGPQSNADTTSYKQAAGQLADPTLPRDIRKKAGLTVLRLMKERKNQFASPEMAAEGVTPSPTGSIHDQADAILKGK